MKTIDPTLAKINADKWPQVEAILRSGTADFGYLNIMLTDDETFRCYIPIANKTSSHIYYMDPANEGVTSNETKIPGGDLNDPLRFKQYSSVEHRHFAMTVFLLPMLTERMIPWLVFMKMYLIGVCHNE